MTTLKEDTNASGVSAKERSLVEVSTSRVGPARSRRLPRAAIYGSAGAATFLLLLEVLPRTGVINPNHLPPVTEILAALGERLQTPVLWEALGQTLVTWSIGLSIAMVGGVVLGILVGGTPLLRDLTASTVEFLRPIPSVALIPVAVLLYGTGMASTLLLVIYASFWQVFIQVTQGVSDVDSVVRDTARSYRFSRLRIATTVIFPTTLPFIITGLRLSSSVALILTITGELLIGTPGLGNLVTSALHSGATQLLYGLTFIAGILGVTVNWLTRRLERAVLHWHPSVRLETIS